MRVESILNLKLKAKLHVLICVSTQPPLGTCKSAMKDDEICFTGNKVELVSQSHHHHYHLTVSEIAAISTELENASLVHEYELLL